MEQAPSAISFRRAQPSEADAVRALVVRSIGRWLVWSTDANALGFYERMGGEITGTEPSGIDDEPLTCMRLDLLTP